MYNENCILPFFLAGNFKHSSLIFNPSSHNNSSQISRTFTNGCSHTVPQWNATREDESFSSPLGEAAVHHHTSATVCQCL